MKIQNQKKQSTKFSIKNVAIVFGEEHDNNTIDEVINILLRVPFNKISIPLNAFKGEMLDNVEEAGKKKCITVGFITSLNKETLTFNVVVFNQYKEAFDNFKEIVIQPEFTMYNDKVTKITRLVATNFDEDDDEVAESENVETTEAE